MSESLCGYELYGEWHLANEGRWAIATKNGKKFFLKQYITQAVEPDRNKVGKLLTEKAYISIAESFSRYKKNKDRINQSLRKIAGAGGNIVVPIDNFVYDHYYTEVTQFYDNTLSEEDIIHLPLNDKRVLLRTLAYAISAIHLAGIVHGDIRPTNVLCTKNALGTYVTRLIDFGASYFENDKPTDPHEYSGDPCYASPELGRIWLSDDHEEPTDELFSQISTKSDIFSLGILFNVILSGELPEYSGVELNTVFQSRVSATVYPFEIILNGGTVTPNPSITDPSYRDLIRDMLDPDPEKRPTATEILDRLRQTIEQPKPQNNRKPKLSGKLSAQELQMKPSRERAYTPEDPWPFHRIIWTDSLRALFSSGEYTELKKERTELGEDAYIITNSSGHRFTLTVQAMISGGYAVPIKGVSDEYGDTDNFLREADRELYTLNSELIRTRNVKIATAERLNAILGKNIVGYDVYDLNTNTSTFYTVPNLLLTKYLLKRSEVPSIEKARNKEATAVKPVADEPPVYKSLSTYGNTRAVLRRDDRCEYEVNTERLRASRLALRAAEKVSPLLGLTVYGYELVDTASNEARFMTVDNLVLTGYLIRKKS